jgi:hypothetical protein
VDGGGDGDVLIIVEVVLSIAIPIQPMIFPFSELQKTDLEMAL